MENQTKDSLEIAVKKRNQVVAHMGCSYIGDLIMIQDLFVRKRYRHKGIEELLISKVNEYAKEKQATAIKVYCGPEPFCPDGQISLEQEISFYQQHGFSIDHYVHGVTPCMVKNCGSEGHLCEKATS